jgi:hypothetical protein
LLGFGWGALCFAAPCHLRAASLTPDIKRDARKDALYEARRIASNIAKLREFMSRSGSHNPNPSGPIAD